MQILLITLPRSAGKFFQLNVNSWLLSKFGNCLTTHHSPEVGVGELLYVKNPEQQGWVKLYHNQLVLMPGAFLIQEEFEKRLNFVCSGKPVVAKYMPIQFSAEEEIQVLQRIIPMFDRVFLLRRKDSADHRLSFCLSNQLDSWLPSKTQRDIITHTVQNPIIPNWELFQSFDKMLDEFMHIIDNLNPSQIDEIWFDDIISCQNDQEFCTYLELPYHPFSFTKDMQEFGALKRQMLNAD